ncbi:MAG TPA: hypothetical protein VNO51_10305 [Ilumatobacteraceae bacterium]|nr:hypothetical protein [Ilumatobacteraceae bacterium]
MLAGGSALGTMLAGRSRSGAPTRRMMRVRPTSGDPSALGGASDPNAGGGPLDAELEGLAGPAGNPVTDAGLEGVVEDPDLAWIDAGDGSATASGIDNVSRGGAISGAGSRAGSDRTATVGKSPDAGIRCAPATETGEEDDNGCGTGGGGDPSAACGPDVWVPGVDTGGSCGAGAWMPAADPAGWGSSP